MLSPGVHFLHNKPTVPNLGDELCSPKHYFEFHSDGSTLIVGGGAYPDLGVKAASEISADVKVAWGIGSSQSLSKPAKPLKRRAILSTYARASTRDRSSAGDGIEHVPCVSCLHPIAETPIGDRPGLFLSKDDRASGSIEPIIDAYPEMIVGTNSMSYADIAPLFAETGSVVTNSYHFAYWSLLSGRSVRLVGYSTKFRDVLDLFELPPEFVPYDRGDANGLARSIEDALERAPLSASSRLSEFREINRRFARSLAEFGIHAAERDQVATPG
ncbi:MAG: hypothetical protein CML29_17545 [Rhizobiales bacterium]|nr:hypothetical protein [Hyphomicrobiales bacterium]MBA70183.1 hypothetical protein [Hyphomicrobiales bacterium]